MAMTSLQENIEIPRPVTGLQTNPGTTMQKRITIDQLRSGMYVHDLNLDWLSHPFLRSRFLVKSEEDLQKIRATGVRELYIDSALGLDSAEAPNRTEIAANIEQDVRKLGDGAAKTRPRVSLDEELGRAAQLQSDARRVVRNMMQDVRLGQQVRVEQMEPLVEKMMSSIMRNSGALLSLGQLKHVDDYTFEHSVNVCALMIAFCRGMGLSANETREAGMGALLHDVGKMKTPLHILNKPGRFTDEEFTIMKRHPGDGYDILRDQPSLGEVPLAVVLQHHERIDGTGYPHRRAGGEIAHVAQLAAIVDVYDAITSDRVYHKGIPPGEAIRKLYEWSRFQFDAELVQKFVRTIGIYPVGALVRLESGKLGWVTDQHETHLLKPRVKVFYDAKRRNYVPPFDLDLSQNFGQGGADRILSGEDPAVWGIDIARVR